MSVGGSIGQEILEYYLPIKKNQNEILLFVATWMDLDGVTAECSKSGRCCMISLPCGISKEETKTIPRTRGPTCVGQKRGGGESLEGVGWGWGCAVRSCVTHRRVEKGLNPEASHHKENGFFRSFFFLFL